jgi:hypothetical protein
MSFGFPFERALIEGKPEASLFVRDGGEPFLKTVGCGLR